MKTFNTIILAGISALVAFTTPATAQQQPYVRFNMGGYNPETGLGGRMAGGYNATTGARTLRMGGYDATTGQYERRTRFFNPTTGEGFTTVTSGVRGEGVTTQINTLQNGSYTCSLSRTVPYSCTQNGSSGQ